MNCLIRSTLPSLKTVLRPTLQSPKACSLTRPLTITSTLKMPHATATFNGKVIAETDTWETVEGSIYFPPSSLDKSVLSTTNTHTTCPWKGLASYYSITVDGKKETDAAWYYPEPKEKAQHIKDYVAFYKNKVDVKSN